MSETDSANATNPQALMGYHELLGMHMVAWEEGRAVVELTIEAKHLNRSGNVHGGVPSMLDSALSLAGLHCEVPGNIRRGMTLSLTCLLYTSPSPRD